VITTPLNSLRFSTSHINDALAALMNDTQGKALAEYLENELIANLTELKKVSNDTQALAVWAGRQLALGDLLNTLKAYPAMMSHINAQKTPATLGPAR
jgi:hypothetical protein